MKCLALFLITFLSGHIAYSQTLKPILLPIGNNEKVVVRGYRGKLQIVAGPTDTVRVEARKTDKQPIVGWNILTQSKPNNILEIAIKGPSEQEDWNKLRENKQLPSFELKVTLPQRALQVFWHQGDIVVSGWQAGLSIQTTSGNMALSKGEGELKLQTIDGLIKVTEHKGNIDIQSFKGKVLLNKTAGVLNCDNHSAGYSLDDHKGPFEINNHSGFVSVKDVKGSVRLKNVGGRVTIGDFSGSLSGELDRGSLVVKATSLQNINIQSKEATVRLEVPKESGAYVSVRSEKGQLWVPRYFAKLRKGRWTEKRGRLKGKERGNIKIISKYGDIVLK